MIGGALQPADPRRFLVEAMVGAMHADGVVDPREVAVLRRHLAGHAFFLDVAPTVADTLISLASDAVACVGDPCARIPTIARGLPSRIHRVTAYAMACEVVRSDDELTAAEAGFLDLLRRELRLGALEAIAIHAALAERRLDRHLEDRIAWIRGITPLVIRLFAMRAQVRGTIDEAHLAAVVQTFVQVPDLRGDPTLQLHELRTAFHAPMAADPVGALRELGASLHDPVDRFWLVVYLLASDGADWRRGRFECLLQHAFGLADDDMDLAALDAQALRKS